MTKQRWKSFSNHIDAEKDEQMIWMKIGKLKPETLQFNWRPIWDSALKPKRVQFKSHLPLPAQCYPQPGFLWYTEWQLIRKIEEKVKTILKLTKSINHGNKERNLRKKSEVIHLIEDFEKQYEALYSMYEDLRREVKNSVGGGDDYDDDDDADDADDEYASSNDAETFYTAEELSARRTETSGGASDMEDTILKDKLTSSSEVKTVVVNLDKEYGEDDSENTSKNSARVKGLEGEVASLKVEISILCELEEQMKKKVSRMEEEMRENEGRFYSLKKQSEVNEEQHLSRISDMQIELNTLKFERDELEERFSSRVESLTKELVNVNSRKAELELELESKLECVVRTETLSSNLERMSEENERLKNKIHDLELEIQSVNVEKEKLHGELSQLHESLSATKNELSNERNKFSAYQNNVSVKIESSEEEIKNLNSKVESLQFVNVEKQKLHDEISELQKSLSVTENELTNERNKFSAYENTMSAKIKSSEEEIKNLKSKVERLQSVNAEKQKLHGEISQLKKSLSIAKNNLLNEQIKFSTYQSNTSTKIESSEEEIKNLNIKLEDLLNDKRQLQTELEKEKEESSVSKSQVEKITRTNFQIIERKAEEMAEEFKKQLEDKYRILSRRIRVAEQLQVENQEWYRKTRETYDQISNDLKERAEKSEIELKNIKDMALTANDALIALDSVASRFEECAANLPNRISKAACELRFAKDWAAGKNRAAAVARGDFECLLRQLDDKEGEIVVFREKVWESENRVRELEKMIKEREDGVLVMEEEKREAIRQLCVWIDYHRSRSDYYKKILSDQMNLRRRPS
ncbi:hypothetical protein ABFS82_01G064800 [Erythranthe guttata]